MEITSRPQQQERETQNHSPIPSPRPDNPPPYPTTFVQADTSTFKQVVQMLTGSSQPDPKPDPNPTKPHPPIRSTGVKKQNGYKLYERRNSLKNGLIINPTPGILPRGLDNNNNNGSPMSPSMLNFPSLVLSPVTPLDHFNNNNNRSSPSVTEDPFKEDRAIAEKGFYLHPSPRNATTPGSEPRLLALFPVTSPRGGEVSESSSN